MKKILFFKRFAVEVEIEDELYYIKRDNETFYLPLAFVVDMVKHNEKDAVAVNVFFFYMKFTVGWFRDF